MHAGAGLAVPALLGTVVVAALSLPSMIEMGRLVRLAFSGRAPSIWGT